MYCSILSVVSQGQGISGQKCIAVQEYVNLISKLIADPIVLQKNFIKNKVVKMGVALNFCKRLYMCNQPRWVLLASCLTVTQLKGLYFRLYTTSKTGVQVCLCAHVQNQ